MCVLRRRAAEVAIGNQGCKRRACHTRPASRSFALSVLQRAARAPTGWSSARRAAGPMFREALRASFPTNLWCTRASRAHPLRVALDPHRRERCSMSQRLAALQRNPAQRSGARLMATWQGRRLNVDRRRDREIAQRQVGAFEAISTLSRRVWRSPRARSRRPARSRTPPRRSGT